MKTTWMVGALFLFTGSSLTAQQDVIRAAMERTFATWGSGDIEAFCAEFATEEQGFWLDGSMLDDQECVIAELRAAYDAGFKPNVTLRHISTLIVGTTAASAAYVNGTITDANGQLLQGPWRFTETRVLQNGRWRIIQWHFSRLGAP